MEAERIHSYIKKLGQLIIGPEDDSSLENRIFILINFLAFIVSLAGNTINIIFNLGLPLILVTAIGSIIMFYFYYRARYTKRTYKYLYPVFVVSCILISFLWFLNGGYNGNTLYLILVVFVPLFLIAPLNRKMVIFITYLLLTLGLILIQYVRPDLIMPYQTEQQRFADIFSGTLVYLLMLCSILTVISYTYRTEQQSIQVKNDQLRKLIQKLQEKNIEIESANKALFINEERLRLVLEATEVGIWDWNAKTNRSWFSPGYYAMLKFHPNEFEMKYESFRNLVHPDDITGIEEMTPNHQPQKENLYIQEFRMRDKLGKWHWILSRGRVIELDESGNIVRMVGVHIDLTEQKKVLESLRFSENQFRSIWENSYDGMRLVDEAGIIRRVNSAFCDMFKLPKEKLEGKNVSVIYEESEGQRIWNVLRNNFVSGKIDRAIERKVVLWDASEIWVELSNVFIDIGEGEKLLLSIFRDITQRKHAQEELIELFTQKNNLIAQLETAKKELEKTNSTKDKFFSILAHDLKNPFFGILGYSELLAVDAKNYTPERIQELALKINETSNKTYRLLENLLEWSRSQTKRIVFSPHLIPLWERGVQVCKDVEAQALQKKIVLSNNFPIGLQVFADANMLDTILRNLISNAVKFTRIGGAIRLSAESENGFVRISVHDNGVGIQRDIIESLFSVEEKTVSKGTSGEEGTGLGLIICTEFVKKHGGELWAESKLNEGSTFIFTIPDHEITLE
ncbi:MAG: PAS domain S-box protein [Ignavibacteria bacterium]|nr:PAS domain S-box protein [Ignavibacteria bacterium]